MGASHESARSKPLFTPCSRMLLASSSWSAYSVAMWSSTLSKASASSCIMRWTFLPMRTQMAGTQLNENAFIWSSATTMSASGFLSTKRSPIFADGVHGLDHLLPARGPARGLVVVGVQHV